ncbi:MSHA biogenesis protein MshA, partial [Vibrio coralliirubri]|uniref:MSHA biogenesis protein MshA n=1 Tax=Vibrio coralliirubri TaxID=1516159 RepID=UPI002FD399CC
GLKGAMSGAAGITYGKAAIDGQDGATGAISVGTSTLNLVNGYPEATSTALSLVVEGLDEWTLKGTPSDDTIRYGIAGYTTECVQYEEAADSENGANITVFTPATNGTECND